MLSGTTPFPSHPEGPMRGSWYLGRCSCSWLCPVAQEANTPGLSPQKCTHTRPVSTEMHTHLARLHRDAAPSTLRPLLGHFSLEFSGKMPSHDVTGDTWLVEAPSPSFPTLQSPVTPLPQHPRSPTSLPAPRSWSISRCPQSSLLGLWTSSFFCRKSSLLLRA